jgi:hypothetical protein
MDKIDKTAMKLWNIEILCENPLEIQSKDGGTATQDLAYFILDKARTAHIESLKVFHKSPIIKHLKTKQGQMYFPNVEYEEFTCAGCVECPKCEFAFDLYNLDGSCLLYK